MKRLALILALVLLPSIAQAQAIFGGGGGSGGGAGSDTTAIHPPAGSIGGTATAPTTLQGDGANGVFPINAQSTTVGASVLNPAATPTGLTVTPTGGAATQRCYRAACVSNTLTTLAATEVCDAAGPTTLTGAAFETVAATFPQNGCDHIRFYGRATGAELKTSDCPGGTNCIAAAGGVISWKDDGSQTPSGALPTVNQARTLTISADDNYAAFQYGASFPQKMAFNASGGADFAWTGRGSPIMSYNAPTTSNPVLVNYLTVWSWGPLLRTKTADYVMTAQDVVVFCDATSAAVTITLPAANSLGASAARTVQVVKKDSSGNACTVSRAGSDTFVGGATTSALAAQGNSHTFISDGASLWGIF